MYGSSLTFSHEFIRGKSLVSLTNHQYLTTSSAKQYGYESLLAESAKTADGGGEAYIRGETYTAVQTGSM